MPTLHMEFEAGTTGEVEFVCKTFRFDSDGNEISAPFSQVEPITPGDMAIDLISGEDPDVDPNPWSYTVFIRVDGQREFVCFLQMPMTTANFVDLVRIEAPPTPEWFVLKSEFLQHVDNVTSQLVPTPEGEDDGLAPVTSGGEYILTPIATQDDIDDAVAVETAARIADVNAEEAARIADVDAEEARALAAEGVLDGRLDTAETDINTVEAGLAQEILDRAADVDAEEAARIADVNAEESARIADVDAEESRALAAEALLAPKANPAFTGNPTAPTPSPGDNDTSLATTAFVADAVATETTNRIADVNAEETARIADVDAEESRALAAEALLAPKASPTFTGDPKAPTPTSGDNDTSIATTAFVQTELGLYVPKSLADAKGDIIVATGDNVWARKAVGSNDTFLVADSTQSDGLRYRVIADSDLPTVSTCSISDSAQSLTNDTNTTLGTGATEATDTDGYHSNVTNPSRITIPNFGATYWFFIVIRTAWASNATGYRRVNLLKNGSALQTVYVWQAANGSAMNASMMFPVQGANTDYFEAEGRQTSGGNLNGTLTEFAIYRWKKA